MSMSVMVPEPALRKPEPAQRKPESNNNDMSLVDKKFNAGLPYQDKSRRNYQSFNPPQIDSSFSAAGYQTA